MSFRFFRRVKVMPGVTVNFSKSGASMSFGTRGAHYTVGPRGRRTTVGIPGTGLYYTQTSAPARKRVAATRRIVAPAIAPSDRLDLGFWKSLTTPPEERELVEGIKSMLANDEGSALGHFRKASHLADGAFMAGLLAYRSGDAKDAIVRVRYALDHVRELGRTVAKYGATATFSLGITDTLVVHLQPSEESALLVLTEAYQRTGDSAQALECCDRLQQIAPDDVVAKVSFAELLLDGATADPGAANRVISLTTGLTNDTPAHSAALLYRGRALRLLALPQAAADTLTIALARRADRSPDLMHALRYERALAYEALGQGKRARAEFERVYAEDPAFADVAKRLGVATGPVGATPAESTS